MNEERVFYFGCVGVSGHYMHGVDGRSAHRFTQTNPWGYGVDGSLLPKSQIEGRAFIHHKDGWTALSFWDRSVDSRRGSHSTFLAEGSFGFDEMVAFGKKHFPEVWARYTFPVVEAWPSV